MPIDPALEAALRRHIAVMRGRRDEAPFNLRLPRDAHDLLKQLSAERDESMNSLVIDLMAEGIKPLRRRWDNEAS